MKQGQSGNVFTVLIGAVALVGVVAVASMNMLSGPVATSSRVMQKTMADSQMFGTNKMIIMDAVNGASGGDCDGDGYVEPAEFRIPTTEPVPAGGGLIPTDIGTTATDPWGTEYGYCVWNVQDATANAACDDNTDTTYSRLKGDADLSDGPTAAHYVMAVISAGPDRIFQSSCSAWVTDATTLLTTAGDDIVQPYTYSDAAAATSSVWTIETGTAESVTIDKGVKFADQTVATTCGANDITSMRYNGIIDKIQVCDGAGTWNNLSNIFELNTVPTPNVVRNTGAYATEDFVFGSPQLADDTDATHDNRFWFDKSKGAFRAGQVNAAQWDDASVGNQSFATGSNNTASGNTSTALGSSNTASGLSSAAIGASNNATGNYSVALGYVNTASVTSLGNAAIGWNNTSSNTATIAMGFGNTASSIYGIAIGSTNTASGVRAIALGNAAIAQSINGMALGTEAKVTATGTHSVAWGIGDATGAKPQVSGADSFGIFMGDQTGADVDDATTMAIVGGDFVVGSPQLADDTDTAHDYRMWFDISKGAFRAGRVVGTEWDDASVGSYSTAFGLGNTAFGAHSMAGGNASSSNADSSFAFGAGGAMVGNSGLYGVAMGYSAFANGNGAIALGQDTDSTGSQSVAIGRDADATGAQSVAIGREVDVVGANSMGFGLGVPVGTDPKVSGANSLGVFMGDQTGVDVTAANTMAIMGGNVGIGTVSPTSPLDVTKTYDGALALNGQVATRSTLSHTGSSASSRNGAAIEGTGISSATGAGTTTVVGVKGVAGTSAGSGGTATGWGVYGQGTGTSDTNTQYVTGVRGMVLTHDTDLGYALSAGNTSTSTGGTAYGLHINLTDTDVTRWGIYQQSVNDNYFAGDIGIGVTAPAHAIDVVGTAGLSTGTTWTNTSDIRLKNIDGDYEKGLSDILNLNTVRFHYKDDNPIGLPSAPPQIGFVAQEVQPIFPEAVSTRDDGYLDFNMHSINVALVNAVKELHADNVALKKEVGLIQEHVGLTDKTYEKQRAQLMTGLLAALVLFLVVAVLRRGRDQQ